MMEIPQWLLKETFGVQYNPNCPKPFLVRMVGKPGYLDWKPYISWRDENEPCDLTRDALGFGLTLEEAANAAKKHREILIS